MIKLISDLPEVSSEDLGFLKIKCLFDCYGSDKNTLFWRQDEASYLSLSVCDMVISEGDINAEELREFIAVISPKSIFCPYDTAVLLGLAPNETVNVMRRQADIMGDTDSDCLSSRDLYDIMDISEFTLPNYPDFAVDYCRRFNMGQADYYGIKNKCAAVSLSSGGYTLIIGIVIRQKGFGEKALIGIIKKNYGKTVLAYCRDGLTGFYEKYGFKKLDKRYALINEYK